MGDPEGDRADRARILVESERRDPPREPLPGSEKPHDRRPVRTLFVGVGIVVTLAAAFAGLTGWALETRSDAIDAAESARSIALALASNEQLATHLDASLLLSLE